MMTELDGARSFRGCTGAIFWPAGHDLPTDFCRRNRNGSAGDKGAPRHHDGARETTCEG
jgi:hypothetical protein